MTGNRVVAGGCERLCTTMPYTSSYAHQRSPTSISNSHNVRGPAFGFAAPSIRLVHKDLASQFGMEDFA